MCAPLLALLLAAAPPSVAVTTSDPAAVEGLRAFLSAAAAHAPLLEPGPLGRTLGSGLALDLLDRSAWAAAGLEPKGAITALVLADGTSVLVLPVKDARKVQARAQLGLASRGEVAQERASGLVTLTALSGATVQGRVVVGKGKVGLWMGGGNPARVVDALSARLPAPERARGLEGPITVLADAGPRAGLGGALNPHANELGVQLRLAGEGPLVAAGVESALGRLAFPGALVLRAQASPLALQEFHGGVIPRVQRLLPAAAQEAFAHLTEQLSGSVALAVAGLDVDAGRGQSEADGFFLLRQVLAAQVKDPARAAEALATLTQQAGAEAVPLTAPGRHARIRIAPRRELLIGLAGDVLYLANDASSRDALLAALPSARGVPEHAGELVVDGARAAALLGKISVLDAARSPLLAAIFVVAVEGGPLLRGLGTTRMVIDPDPRGARVTGTLHVAPPAR